MSMFPLEKLCAETVYLFSTYLKAEFPLGAVTKVLEFFFVDVQYIFIYCIWLRESKVMGQTASNSEN